MAYVMSPGMAARLYGAVFVSFLSYFVFSVTLLYTHACSGSDGTTASLPADVNPLRA